MGAWRPAKRAALARAFAQQNDTHRFEQDQEIEQ
jgi:hypothetical protein